MCWALNVRQMNCINGIHCWTSNSSDYLPLFRFLFILIRVWRLQNACEPNEILYCQADNHGKVVLIVWLVFVFVWCRSKCASMILWDSNGQICMLLLHSISWQRLIHFYSIYPLCHFEWISMRTALILNWLINEAQIRLSFVLLSLSEWSTSSCPFLTWNKSFNEISPMLLVVCVCVCAFNASVQVFRFFSPALYFIIEIQGIDSIGRDGSLPLNWKFQLYDRTFNKWGPNNLSTDIAAHIWIEFPLICHSLLLLRLLWPFRCFNLWYSFCAWFWFFLLLAHRRCQCA